MQELFNEAESLFKQGKLEQAKARFLDIITQDKNNKEAYNNLGVIAFKLDNFEDALSQISCALEIDPDYQDAKENLIIIKNAIDQKAAKTSQREKYQAPEDFQTAWHYAKVAFSPNPVTRLNALV